MTQHPEKEVCKCELDGFQGAITSQNCGIHNTQESWEEKLEDLKCVNGAMYFGAVEDPCQGRDTGECCHNEQTYDEALAELKSFIHALLSKQAEEISEAVEGLKKRYKYDKNDICDVCDYLINSGESHFCGVYNATLSDTLLAIKQVINK